MVGFVNIRYIKIKPDVAESQAAGKHNPYVSDWLLAIRYSRFGINAELLQFLEIVWLTADGEWLMAQGLVTSAKKSPVFA